MKSERIVGLGGRRGRFVASIRYVLTALVFNAVVFSGAAIWDASAAETAPVRILALGDSLVAGYGLPAEQGFVPQLRAALAALGVRAEIQQGGVSGDTTAGGRARLAWALQAKPHVAIVELGGNDGLRGLDPADTKANLDAILRRLKAAKIPVLLTGMLAPPNLGREYGADFNAIFPALAKAHGVMLYPFFLDGVAADPRLNQRDGIHPNAAGVKIVAARIAPYVKRLIAAARDNEQARQAR
ncbi:MAG TPA: arylesterase [Alphaproteobacteria bacterium]|nr:arylesterase [Alphaproteobacteria bacterium]